MRKNSGFSVANRIFAGRNVRIRRTRHGDFINFDGGSADFSHPWQTTLNGVTSASFLNGQINGVDATINGVPLEGSDTDPAPELEFGEIMLDSVGRGWICAEVTCDPDKDWEIKTLEMVQVADPDTDDGSPGESLNASGAAVALPGNRARIAIAMLRQRASGDIDFFQIVYFNLQHRVSLAAGGKTAQRHFFW